MRRSGAIEWVALFMVPAVVVGIVTGRPVPWIVGGAGGAALAIARAWVLRQWALGRMPGRVAILLHVALMAATAAGFWALVAFS